MLSLHHGWPPAQSIPCTPGSLSNCSPHVLTYMSHRPLEIHTSRYPTFPCQTSSPCIFPILWNSTLYLPVIQASNLRVIPASFSSLNIPNIFQQDLSRIQLLLITPTATILAQATIINAHITATTSWEVFLFLHSLPFPVYSQQSSQRALVNRPPSY